MASFQTIQEFDYETVNEILTKFGPDIRKKINTRNIFPEMRKRLTDADLQPLECLCNNEGSMRAADGLMDAIKRKPKSFIHFIYTVHKEKHFDIVDQIRNYLSLRKRHTTLLTYLDKKLQKKGLKIKSKNVMVVEPFGPQTPCDTPLPVLPSVMGHPLQPHSGQGQGQPQIGQEPAANVTVRQQPVHAPTVQSREVPKLPAAVQPNLIPLLGTTNIPNSADIVLTEIPYNLFSKLSEELHGRDPPNWMKLAKEFPFLKRSDVKNIEKEKNPGEALLDMLGGKECTVHQLEKALEKAGLQNELDILQEHYAVGNFVEGQQGYVSSLNIQEPVNSQQQQERHAVLNQSLSASATGQERQTLERIDESNLNMAAEQSTKREVKTKNLNIPGDAGTDISNALDTLNICGSQTQIFSKAVPEPQKKPSADVSMTVFQSLSQVSLDNNNVEMLVGDYQHSGRMLNTASEGQSSENVMDNNPTETEGDPLGKSAIHNADIDRLHLKQEVHQQGQQQDLSNTSLSGSFRDIHNDPGHVTMPMDSEIRNIAETS